MLKFEQILIAVVRGGEPFNPTHCREQLKELKEAGQNADDEHGHNEPVQIQVRQKYSFDTGVQDIATCACQHYDRHHQ